MLMGPDAATNLGRFEALRAMKDQFEQALGEAAVWDEKPGRKSKAVYIQSQFGGVENVEQWPI